MLPQRARPRRPVQHQERRREAAPGSMENRKRGFTTSLLRERGWLERISGSNVASPAKGSRHGKLSSFHPVEQRLHAGRERHAAAAAIGGHALIRGETRFVTTNPQEQEISRARSLKCPIEVEALRAAASPAPQTKNPAFPPGFYLNPSNPFRRLRPPRQRRRHRLRHPPRRLRRQFRSPRSWRHGAGSWLVGSRFP